MHFARFSVTLEEFAGFLYIKAMQRIEKIQGYDIEKNYGISMDDIAFERHNAGFNISSGRVAYVSISVSGTIPKGVTDYQTSVSSSLPPTSRPMRSATFATSPSS